MTRYNSEHVLPKTHAWRSSIRGLRRSGASLLVWGYGSSVRSRRTAAVRSHGRTDVFVALRGRDRRTLHPPDDWLKQKSGDALCARRCGSAFVEAGVADDWGEWDRQRRHWLARGRTSVASPKTS